MFFAFYFSTVVVVRYGRGVGCLKGVYGGQKKHDSCFSVEYSEHAYVRVIVGFFCSFQDFPWFLIEMGTCFSGCFGPFWVGDGVVVSAALLCPRKEDHTRTQNRKKKKN